MALSKQAQRAKELAASQKMVIKPLATSGVRGAQIRMGALARSAAHRMTFARNSKPVRTLVEGSRPQD